MNLATFIPQLNRVKNEVVMWVGIVISVLLYVQEELAGLDWTSIDGWMTLLPAAVAYIARQFNTGPETAAANAANA